MLGSELPPQELYQDFVGGGKMNIYCSIKVELNKEEERFRVLCRAEHVSGFIQQSRTRNEFKTRNINHKPKISMQRKCKSFKQLSVESEEK